MSSPDPRAHDRSDFSHGEQPSSMREKKSRMAKEEPSSAKGKALHIKKSKKIKKSFDNQLGIKRTKEGKINFGF